MVKHDYKCNVCETTVEISKSIFDESDDFTCRIEDCQGRLVRLFSPTLQIQTFKGPASLKETVKKFWDTGNPSNL